MSVWDDVQVVRGLVNGPSSEYEALERSRRLFSQQWRRLLWGQIEDVLQQLQQLCPSTPPGLGDFEDQETVPSLPGLNSRLSQLSVVQYRMPVPSSVTIDGVSKLKFPRT